MFNVVGGHVEVNGTFSRTVLWVTGWHEELKGLAPDQISFIHGLTGKETELVFTRIAPIETFSVSQK